MSRENTWLDKIANIIRVATVPPVMALLLIFYLYQHTPNHKFIGIAALCLVLLPLAAYPVHRLASSKNGREGQRRTAFKFTFVSYLLLEIYTAFFCTERILRLVGCTYFLTVLILTILNLFRIKASGHAASSSAVLIFFVYLKGSPAILPCLALMTAIFWASIRTGRHTVEQLVLGTSACLAGFIISLAIL